MFCLWSVDEWLLTSFLLGLIWIEKVSTLNRPCVQSVVRMLKPLITFSSLVRWLRICRRCWLVGVLFCFSFLEWSSWLDSSHIPSKAKIFLDGVGGTLLWSIWNFRNRLVFLVPPPKKAILWDSIISQSFLWISSRNPKFKFSWVASKFNGLYHEKLCLIQRAIGTKPCCTIVFKVKERSIQFAEMYEEEWVCGYKSMNESRSGKPKLSRMFDVRGNQINQVTAIGYLIVVHIVQKNQARRATISVIKPRNVTVLSEEYAGSDGSIGRWLTNLESVVVR
ncbi:hypothetical protein Tco_0215613 [Tanacetum coccineum]